MTFTPWHRGGSGPPLVCLHGFADTWRSWELAARGRARTVVALAPAGGWARGDESYRTTLELQRSLVETSRSVAPHADWVELDGAGHCPQLDVPLETAQLILGFTDVDPARARSYRG